MPTLVLARDLIDDLNNAKKIDPSIRDKVLALPGKFAEATHTGAHLEKITAAADPHVRTVRVDKYWRGIVFRPDNGDTFVLTRVLGEEDANAYAAKVRFTVNPLNGAIEITDVNRIEAEAPAEAASGEAGLLDDIDDDTLALIGVTQAAIPVLRRIHTWTELDALTGMLPPTQGGALQMLAAGRSVDDVLEELTQPEVTDESAVSEDKTPEIDTADFAAAMERPGTKAEFVILDNDADLDAVFDDDFALWKVFLHPTQEAYAHKPTFNGPAKLTGAAGTGKTIAAIHRAQYLAHQATTDGDPTDRILFTTFTTALADGLTHLLAQICTPEELRRIDVINIDKYAADVVAEQRGRRVQPIFDVDRLVEDHWRPLLEDAGLQDDFTARFIHDEFNDVILGGPTAITTKRDYLTVARTGRGVRLSRSQRSQLWSVFEGFTKRMDDLGALTHLQIADAAASILDARFVRPYRHVIVDEAQDFHAAQWRVARAAVRPADEQLANDLFIVGDAHQRIYDNRVVLSHLGIETRGRSRRLRLNYRTSHQIHRWAIAARSGAPVDDLDGQTETLDGSHSAFSGPAPEIHQHVTARAEADAIAADIVRWLTDPDLNLKPQEIAVVARTSFSLTRVEDALAEQVIKTHRLGREITAPDGHVVLSTMHRVKGGEYRAVVLTDITKDQLPLPKAIAPKEDKERRDQDMERERSLLYVAASRARELLAIHYSGTPSPLLPNAV